MANILPAQAYYRYRDQFLDEFLYLGRSVHVVKHIPELAPVTPRPPEPDESLSNKTEVVPLYFETVRLRMFAPQDELVLLRVTDREGRIIEQRPLSERELTILSSRVSKGYRNCRRVD